MPDLREGSSDAFRDEAAHWFGKMQGPDADRLRLDFERWRATDPRRRAAYAELDSLWRASAGLANSPLAREPVLGRSRTWFARPAPRFALAGAAALVALVGGVYLFRPQSPRPALVAEADTIASRLGEIRTVRLADGTSVVLDTDSALRLSFSGEARMVRLVRGRARFDVAPDPKRAFLVEAGGRTVVAHGTVFDVALDREGVRVSLLRGAVEVCDGPAGALEAPRVRLAPGEYFAATGPKGGQVAASPRDADQWTAGMLSFDGAPLSRVIEAVNRYSARKLRLGDTGLGELRVTGVFRPLPTEELAAALSAAFNLRAEPAPDGGFILHAR